MGTIFILLISGWFILQSSGVQSFLVRKLTERFSQKLNTTISVKGVSLSFFNKIVLEDVLIKDRNNDSLLFVHELVASINSFSIKKRTASIEKLELNKTFININSDSAGHANYQFLLDSLAKKDTVKTESLSFNFNLKRFDFTNALFRYSYRDSAENHTINLNNITLGVNDFETKNEKTAFTITQLQLNDLKDFRLEDFSARFVAKGDSISLQKLHASTANSVITEANITLNKKNPENGFDLKNMKVDLSLKKSGISLKDIGIVVPALKGMEEKIDLSGQVSGTLADLKGKDISLNLGNNTQLDFDIYLNGLPDLASTYMHIDLKQSFADFNDVKKVKLPTNFPIHQLEIPTPLLQAGIIEYKGNFTGFLSDFVAFGTFRSRWGVLTTDLSFVPSKDKNLKINGRLRTVDFKLGELLQSDILGGVTFNGNIEGIINQKTNDFAAKISGRIDSIKVIDYQYKNIQMDGNILKKKFEGNMVVNDPNLKLKFNGKFDLNEPVPVFNFDMLVDKADLKALNFDRKYKQSKISFALNANFTGNNIDNLDGLIHLSKGTYKNENDSVLFNDFNLKTYNDGKPALQIRSDFMDADLHGQYQLHKLHNSFLKIIATYLPSVGFSVPAEETQNNFDFNIALKDINRFTKALLPDLKMNTAAVSGSINSTKNTLKIDASFPEIKYQSAVFQKYTINIESDSKLNIRNKIGEFDLGQNFVVHNLSVISEAANNVLDSKLSWNNFGEVSYSGSVNTSAKFFRQKNAPHIEISVKPTRMFVADTLWQINSSLITIDSTLVKVDKLKLSNKGQYIMVDGSITPNQSDKLNILFHQIDLNSLNTFIGGDIDLKGGLNGGLSVLDLYRRPLILADLKISGLGLLDQPIGDASVQTVWDPVKEEVNAGMLVNSGEKRILVANGIYNPGKDSLSVFTNFDHFSLLILQPLLGSTFAHFHGDATGKVHLYGPMGHLQHEGALFASKAGLMLTDLQVNYTLNDSVRFAGDKIIFPQMRVVDDLGNSGIFNGTIQHKSFSKMVYDLSVKSNKILAINTTSANNEQFYGKLFGSGNLRITGKESDILIDGVARTEKGTEMNIFLEYSAEAQQYDFLNFVNFKTRARNEIKKPTVPGSKLLMKFNVEITPEAKEQLIFNSKIGDIIRGQGSGNMQIEFDNNSNLSLYGEYTVEQGDYLFTLQNVINKKFEIQRGGTIQWNGDPQNAVVDLNAIYRLKASLSELFVNSTETADLNKRIPVLCKIALSKNLNNPEIKFDIELPSTESRINDEIRQFINSEEDMNKQILSLLVLGKFYTPEYLRGNFAAINNNLMGSTASELLSNQFSNWLSQINNDFDIGIKYRPGNQISKDEVELALGTQMFNDRVSINGNIGNNSSQRANANNSGLVGDADVNVKITRNGKLQLKAYNHVNNNLIYETSPYTQGVGISYREDFNSFNDLWRKLKSIFRRKPPPARRNK